MILIIIWLIILILIIFSYLNSSIPLWTPLIIYLLMVFVRAKEKIGNYKDWEKLNKRDEELELNETAEDMAGRGLAFSGARKKAEGKIKENFEFERKKQKRKMVADLINTLSLR